MEVARSIQDKTLLAFIGAFAVGKTTLMNKIAQTDERFSEVISFTTRPSRGAGDTYRFIDHNPKNIADILDKAEQGSLINFAIHPTTGYIYGTEPADYRTEFCMLATIANNFHLSTGQLPFRSVRPVAVVAEPEVWIERIHKRPMSQPDYAARMSEAKQSLEWSIAHNDAHFIDNTRADVETTAHEFVEHADAASHLNTTDSREVAQRMLSYINTELDTY